ncbi:MAG: hypothetical protein F4Y47_03740 [Acidobacteriia bacterium]|nr:hypothetical protein [Terriglobia bacterium]MYG04866.1 hypothetical protein [Terriglobia bacterium]MYK08101.1 hypothetical protein [Terriglobia bacterium]
MELGANKRSLIHLGVAVAVLAIVVYVQFFSGSGGGPAPAAQRPSVSAGRTSNQPPIADPQAQNEPDFAADATLRKDLLERVRAIETPVVDRDIFNFGRPKPREIAGPTREEARLAQAKLEAAARKPAPKRAQPAARPAPKTVRPPDWKYYGLASSAQSETRRAFLLDGDEILLASEGSVLQGRYRIMEIGRQAVTLEDTQEDQEFSIPLEFPQ